MRQAKKTHPNYIKYLESIVTHKNYNGLPYTRKKSGEINCVATGKSAIGIARQKWAEKKKKEYGIDEGDGSNAKLMYELHPTKRKPCQTCGTSSEISYVYPTKNTLKKLDCTLGVMIDNNMTLKEVIVEHVNISNKQKLISLLKSEFSINSESNDLNTLADVAEYKCRIGGLRKLSPGAMSNFPDRLDGFHSYNRCCRTTHDSGRSKENMATYNKDRRAYEFLSDGNIHAANKFMRAEHFRGLSADHIGPISLGFIHDPRYIEPLETSDNSSKRDRIDKSTVERIIEIESKSGISAVSWFAFDIWAKLKTSHLNGEKRYRKYRDAFKINMISFLKCLHDITEICETEGWEFINEVFIRAKIEFFKWEYDFDTNGEIIKKHKRNISSATDKEPIRFERVVKESIISYSRKSNRKNSAKLINLDEDKLELLCEKIKKRDFYKAKEELKKISKYIQEKSIETAFGES